MVSVITPSYQRFGQLVSCVDSVRSSEQSSDEKIEIVIVTSGYNETELAELRKRDCQVITLSQPASTSDSRNIGASSSTGDYLLFLDDDNVVAPDSVSLLWQSLAAWADAVLVGPAMYYGDAPDRLWCAGVSRSRVFMKTTFRRELPPALPARMPSEDFPNCFMVRRSDFLAVNGFDSIRFPQHMEEADLARRLIRSTGGSVFLVSSARIWHFIDTRLVQRLHLHNAERAYLCARGRAIFTATHGDWLQWVAYVIVAQWLFAALYLGAALSLPLNKRLDVMRGYCHGLWDGLLAGWRAKCDSRLGGRDVHGSVRI